MSRIFDYNGNIVAPSNPVKQLKTVKRTVIIDSGDRDTAKYDKNGDFVVYLPRVYENVVSIRLAAAEFPNPATATAVGVGTGGSLSYFLIDIEGLNKKDECSLGADRSGFPDGYFAKIPITFTSPAGEFYNDHAAQENISHYSPPIGKLDRMHIRIRFHNQKVTGGYFYWPAADYSMTLEVEMLDNSFDEFSSFESRVMERR